MPIEVVEKEFSGQSAVKITREPIEVKSTRGGIWYNITKRLFDIISSFCVIIVSSPVLLILFIIQMFATKGHPIFKDKRLGYNGEEITIYKFRSMYYDAESNIDKYLTAEQKEIWLRERKLDDDPRITPFGKFLRKTSLDELPQLFNILFGSLSVVGWRPISLNETVNFYPSELEILFRAKPGLTGYWQVYGRSDVDFESGERQRLELEYFEHRSFWFDLGLIFKTIPAVIHHKGAR